MKKHIKKITAIYIFHNTVFPIVSSMNISDENSDASLQIWIFLSDTNLATNKEDINEGRISAVMDIVASGLTTDPLHVLLLNRPIEASGLTTVLLLYAPVVVCC